MELLGFSRGGISVLAIALSVSTPAYALDFTTFTDRGLWEAELSSTTLENFNSVPSDVQFGGSSTTVNSLTLRSNATNASYANIDTPVLSSFANVDGTSYFRSFGLTANTSIFVDLPSEFSGFGFDYNNVDTQGDALSVFISNQFVVSLPTSNGATGFIGIVATDGSFDEVEFRSTINVTHNSIDNVEWGNVSSTPVPFEVSPTLGLLTVGGIWVLSRLRKKRSKINH